MLSRLLICLLLLMPLAAFSQSTPEVQPRLTNETPAEKEARLSWWKQDRFGLFIHFGLYAIPARHEWVKTLEKIPESHYDQYFESFNPERYDPKAWARQAKAAGMKYVVITTKHHDGFCLFDSKYTDYKSTNTPYGKDLIREYVDAFRAEGLKVGFYYSIIDWHHPEYPVDFIHPLEAEEFFFLSAAQLALALIKTKRNDRLYAAINKDRDMAIYREYMFNQVRELLTNYGQIDVMWFDFSTKKVPGAPASEVITGKAGKSITPKIAEDGQGVAARHHRQQPPGFIHVC
jgi:alpha-L-fucosidase